MPDGHSVAPGPARSRTCAFHGGWDTIPPVPGAEMRSTAPGASAGVLSEMPGRAQPPQSALRP